MTEQSKIRHIDRATANIIVGHFQELGADIGTDEVENLAITLAMFAALREVSVVHDQLANHYSLC